MLLDPDKGQVEALLQPHQARAHGVTVNDVPRMYNFNGHDSNDPSYLGRYDLDKNSPRDTVYHLGGDLKGDKFSNLNENLPRDLKRHLRDDLMGMILIKLI